MEYIGSTVQKNYGLVSIVDVRKGLFEERGGTMGEAFTTR